MMLGMSSDILGLLDEYPSEEPSSKPRTSIHLLLELDLDLSIMTSRYGLNVVSLLV